MGDVGQVLRKAVPGPEGSLLRLIEGCDGLVDLILQPGEIVLPCGRLPGGRFPGGRFPGGRLHGGGKDGGGAGAGLFQICRQGLDAQGLPAVAVSPGAGEEQAPCQEPGPDAPEALPVGGDGEVADPVSQGPQDVFHGSTVGVPARVLLQGGGNDPPGLRILLHNLPADRVQQVELQAPVMEGKEQHGQGGGQEACGHRQPQGDKNILPCAHKVSSMR